MSDGPGDEGAPSPAWIALVGPEQAEGELAETYRRIGARSRVDNIIGVHSLHPAAMEAHLELYRTLMFGPSPLSRLEPQAMEEADVDRLREVGWSDEANLHACEVVAYFNFVNRTADGLGVTLEERWRARS